MSQNTLKEICDKRRAAIADKKQRVSEQALYEQALQQSMPRGFHRALQAAETANGIGLIAEIKKASPSKGLIRADFDVPSLARAYHAAGATCMSVLTEPDYFQGADAYLATARAAAPLPALRKDFMLEPYQILESRALGADCILLIIAALSDAQAAELCSLAHDLTMDVLVEVHDAAEMERALTHVNSPLIGINNRNLKTLEVSLETGISLRGMIPDHYTAICESGIASHADITRMREAGFHHFLVGESLMRHEDVTAATKALLGN